MKTRVMKLSDTEYVPQFYVPNFLWGGTWKALEQVGGTFYSHDDVEYMLKCCIVDTEERAERILYEFLAYTQKKEKLRND